MSSVKYYSFFLLLQLFSKASAIEVASNKLAAYCTAKPSSNAMVDGIKTSFEAFTNPCEHFSYVKVELGGKFAVHYVIVFEGEGNDDGQLDFFTVNFLEKRKLEICGEYPGIVTMGNRNKGLRVNCANRYKKYPVVLIHSLKNIGFAIAEIEVHSLVRPGEEILTHVGCFSNFGSTGMERNPASCSSFCQEQTFAFAGLKNKKMCACSNKVNNDEKLPNAYCDVPCDVTDKSPQKFCGGKNSYSVYLVASVLPYYIGCLSTSEDFISNSVGNGDMTVAKCLHLCENKNYALLQSGDHCICLEMIAEDDIFQKGCSITCTGDANSFCGDKQQASVYSTCFTEMVALACSEFFKCEGSYDMYGDCGGVCKPGFLGDNCLEIDPDECKTKPCDDLTTDCINLKGSYVCQCKAGFTKLNDYTCQRNETNQFGFENLIDYLLFLVPLVLLLVPMIWFCFGRPNTGAATNRESRISN